MHRVVALVSAPQASFELGCAAAVFREAPYRFSVCTERPGNVRTTEGFDIVVTSGLSALDRADTVVVPGWLPINREPTAAVMRALTRAHRRGTRLVSICSGAYVLAATGLLDGRRVATHWRYADELQRRFPQYKWIRTCSTSTTVTLRRVVDRAPGSTCACSWSATTTARRTPRGPPGAW